MFTGSNNKNKNKPKRNSISLGASKRWLPPDSSKCRERQTCPAKQWLASWYTRERVGESHGWFSGEDRWGSVDIVPGFAFILSTFKCRLLSGHLSFSCLSLHYVFLLPSTGKIFKKVRAKNLAFCLNKNSFSGLLLIFLLFPQCIKLEKSCWTYFPTKEKK